MWRDIVIAVIAFLAGLITTWGSVYLTHRLQMERDVRLREQDARLHAYATLMGLRRVVTQLYMSRFEALIHSDYHEARWGIAGYPKDSLDLREAERWMHISENLALEVAKADQQLFEAVGSVRVMFPGSAKLQELTDAVYNHLAPANPARPDPAKSADELEKSQTEAVKRLQDVVRQTVKAPIDALIEHLTHCIEADKQSWWSRLRAGNARRIAGQ